jgi:hypothetical protein
MTKDDAIKAIENYPATLEFNGMTFINRESAIEVLNALPDAGWRDISEAPKDGSRILLAMKDRTGEQMVYEGRWNDKKKHFTSTNGFLLFDNCTHWMPLPPPPEKA